METTVWASLALQSTCFAVSEKCPSEKHIVFLLCSPKSEISSKAARDWTENLQWKKALIWSSDWCQVKCYVTWSVLCMLPAFLTLGHVLCHRALCTASRTPPSLLRVVLRCSPSPPPMWVSTGPKHSSSASSSFAFFWIMHAIRPANPSNAKLQISPKKKLTNSISHPYLCTESNKYKKICMRQVNLNNG